MLQRGMRHNNKRVYKRATECEPYSLDARKKLLLAGRRLWRLKAAAMGGTTRALQQCQRRLRKPRLTKRRAHAHARVVDAVRVAAATMMEVVV